MTVQQGNEMSTGHPVVATPSWAEQVSPVVAFIRESLSYNADTVLDTVERDAKKRLISYPADTLQRIGSARCTDANVKHRLGSLILNGRNHNYVDEAFRFLPVLNANVTRCENALGGLHHYEQLPQCRNFAAQSELVQKQCEALLIVTLVLEELFEKIIPFPLEWIEYQDRTFELTDMYPVIADRRLVKMLLTHPEKAFAITGVIRERRVIDIDLFRDLIENESGALANGLL